MVKPTAGFGIILRWAARFLLGALLCSGTVACMASGQSQGSGQSAGADRTSASTTRARTSARAPKPQAGVWHHFGEANGAPSQRPPAASGWHHFGPAKNAPAALPRPSTAPQRYAAIPASDLERQMYDLLNRDRMNPANADAAGDRARPLRWNEKLAAVARAHSRDMIRRGYFDHLDPDGRAPGDRMQAAGIDWQESGENIAIGPTVAQAEASLMNEPRFRQNHRWNILNSKYTEVGIGIARGPGGEYYITQDFVETAPVR